MINEVDGMRQEDYSKDWVMHIAIYDFERGLGLIIQLYCTTLTCPGDVNLFT